MQIDIILNKCVQIDIILNKCELENSRGVEEHHGSRGGELVAR